MADRFTKLALKGGRRNWPLLFLAKLAETGNVTLACVHAKVSRVAAYRRREANERFREQWDDALEIAGDVLEGYAWERATKGRTEVKWVKRRRVVVQDKPSDALLMFLLRANRPEKFNPNHGLKKILDALSGQPPEEAGGPAADGAEAGREGD